MNTKQLLASLLYLTLTIGAQAQIPKFNHQQKRKSVITATQALADMDCVIQTIKKLHCNPYLYISKKAWGKKIKKYRKKYQRLDSIKVIDFSFDMRNLTLPLGDISTTVGLEFFSEEFLDESSKDTTRQFFPFSVKLTSKKSLEIQNDVVFAGKKVLSINGQSAIKIYKEASRYVVGTPGFRNIFANINFPFFVYYKGIRAPFTLTLADKKGKHVTVSLAKKRLLNYGEVYSRFASFTDPYNLSFLKEGTIAYINHTTNYTIPFIFDRPSLDTFLDSSFKLIKEKKLDKLIIDIRDRNSLYSSSDYPYDTLLSYITHKKYRNLSTKYWKVNQLTKDNALHQIKDKLGSTFAKRYQTAPNGTLITEKFPWQQPKKSDHFFQGKVCVLIGPKTFGNAKILADVIKTYQIATLIGQPTSQRGNDFDEFKSIRLPHSGLWFNYSTAYYIRANGNLQKTSGIKPDVRVKGDALEYAIKWLEKK